MPNEIQDIDIEFRNFLCILYYINSYAIMPIGEGYKKFIIVLYF